ncbi:pseudouridylate synthase TRUB2, mitochondrial-like [Paramacrobiotus metropolitanus]|uniref:pseudouridylate synthase TRUB2, mitochondrial-like n=1 Tax=Paramacrobiotus metropolitanus TaxID=2943436 RepID=UPI0024456B74|nr:pseudouridylate synthase TRUB2, mitochondrial-like [Paramacrobiotus metropolitanus]
MVIIENSSMAFKLLNGVFCIYKPSDLHHRILRWALRTNLCRDLNELPRASAQSLVKIEPPDENSSEYRVTTVPDIRDHPLLLGPAFEKTDFNIRIAHFGVTEMAGVTVCGVGARGVGALRSMSHRNPVCTYHIQGKFGLRTTNYLQTGRVLERTTFSHVTRGRLERFLTFYQGQFQRHIQSSYGVDPRSQTAYELRARGLVRPRDDSLQLIYRLKLVDFQPPYFTVEVHCINETDTFLMKMINDIAEDCKCSAVVTRLRRIRCGNFTLEHALVRSDWTAAGIITNIQECAVAADREMALLDEPFLQRIPAETLEERERIPNVLRLVRE